MEVWMTVSVMGAVTVTGMITEVFWREERRFRWRGEG
jgi:hypothetical protein